MAVDARMQALMRVARPVRVTLGWSSIGRPASATSCDPSQWLWEDDDGTHPAVRNIIGQSRAAGGEAGGHVTPRTALEARRRWAGRLPLPPARTFT